MTHMIDQPIATRDLRRKTMEKGKLETLAAFLDTVPVESFCIERWSDTDRCGFAGCAIGWAAHASRPLMESEMTFKAPFPQQGDGIGLTKPAPEQPQARPLRPLEPLLPGETRSEYLDRLAMEEQMAADFATIKVPPDGGPFRRARVLVETHIANYGMVPHPDKIKHAIGVELGLAEIRGIDRIRVELDSWKAQFESASTAASEYSQFWEEHSGDFDVGGNYIPHSQIDGDLRAAKELIAKLQDAIERGGIVQHTSRPTPIRRK